MTARPAVLVSLLLAGLLSHTAAASPPQLAGISYDQHPGRPLPESGPLLDERGMTTRLSDVAQGRPLILVLGYFHCPSLCGVVRADLFHALQKTDLVAGRDYQLIDVSIDPAESPPDAASAKAQDIARFPVAGAARGWHFLTGAAATVRALSDAVGFKERFDPRLKQYLHPTGIVFVTPGGLISSYLLGVGYSSADVRLAVTRAARGTIQAAALPILLLCYDYDESTGRYTLAIMKLLRLAAGLTVLTLGVTLFLAFRRGHGHA